MAILQERSEIERNEASLGLKVNTREYLFYVGNGLKVYRYSCVEKDLIDSDNGENMARKRKLRIDGGNATAVRDEKDRRGSNTSTKLKYVMDKMQVTLNM